MQVFLPLIKKHLLHFSMTWEYVLLQLALNIHCRSYCHNAGNLPFWRECFGTQHPFNYFMVNFLESAFYSSLLWLCGSYIQLLLLPLNLLLNGWWMFLTVSSFINVIKEPAIKTLLNRVIKVWWSSRMKISKSLFVQHWRKYAPLLLAHKLPYFVNWRIFFL